MRIGVLGLGRMGGPIADHLATVHEVLRNDPALGEHADLASVDVLVTVLPGPAAFVEVAPLLHALRPGATWLDLTSNDPRVAARLASSIRARSVAAPMAGGPAAAVQRRLHFGVGGDPADVEPILTHLGSFEVVGSSAADAHTAKLLSNLLWFGQAVAAAEALALGRRLGLRDETLGPALAAGAGGSRFLDETLDALLADDDILDFGIDRVVEQLEILEQLAAETGAPFEVSAAVVQSYREALARFGDGGELAAARYIRSR